MKDNSTDVEISFGKEQSVLLRDGRVAELSRVQKKYQNGTVLGECRATLDGTWVGSCSYSLSSRSARLLNIEVTEEARNNGVGSAVLNYFTKSMLLEQKKSSIAASSVYKDYIARFMKKNGYTVRPFRRSDRIEYSFYAKNKEQVDRILEWGDNLARVPQDDLEEFSR